MSFIQQTLCKTFQIIAFQTWNRLREGRRADYQLGEETITDLNLLRLKTDHQSELITRHFTRKEESTNGADWEWWFMGPRYQAVGFRVQAKVLKHKSNAFESLHYDNDRGYQADTLIQEAAKPPGQIPLFCLYLDDQNQDGCSLSEEYGCSLISAFEVVNLRENGPTQKKHIDNVQPYMLPWEVLVCHICGPRLGPNFDFPTAVLGRFQATIQARDIERHESGELSLPDEMEDPFQGYQDVEVQEEAPPYVQRIAQDELEAETLASELPEWTRRVTVFWDQQA